MGEGWRKIVTYFCMWGVILVQLLLLGEIIQGGGSNGHLMSGIVTFTWGFILKGEEENGVG